MTADSSRVPTCSERQPAGRTLHLVALRGRARRGWRGAGRRCGARPGRKVDAQEWRCGRGERADLDAEHAVGEAHEPAATPPRAARPPRPPRWPRPEAGRGLGRERPVELELLEEARLGEGEEDALDLAPREGLTRPKSSRRSRWPSSMPQHRPLGAPDRAVAASSGSRAAIWNTRRSEVKKPFMRWSAGRRAGPPDELVEAPVHVGLDRLLLGDEGELPFLPAEEVEDRVLAGEAAAGRVDEGARVEAQRASRPAAVTVRRPVLRPGEEAQDVGELDLAQGPDERHARRGL